MKIVMHLALLALLSSMAALCQVSGHLSSPGAVWPNTWTDTIRVFPFISSPILTEGRNQDLGDSFETVWPPGAIRPVPSSALLMNISSTSVNDTSVGTGARTVEIHCLDSSYDAFFETLTLDGVANVSMAASCIRIQRVVVDTTGSLGVNDGNLSIENSATQYEFVPAGLSISKSAVFTIPRGKRGALAFFSVTTNARDLVEISIITTRSNGTRYSNVLNVADDLFFPAFPFCFSEKTDLEIQANALGGGGSREIEITFSVIPIDGGGDCP